MTYRFPWQENDPKLGSRRFHNKPCHYCQRTMIHGNRKQGLSPTKDHIIPQSAVRGTGFDYNGKGLTVWCCYACNSMKGSMSPVQWKEFMERNPNWWETWSSSKRRPVGRLPTGWFKDYYAGGE